MVRCQYILYNGVCLMQTAVRRWYPFRMIQLIVR